MTCPLEVLHRDNLVQVFSHLDNYSVLCLLQAFPELSQYAVLITDHKLPPLFFSIPGIRRALLDTPMSRNLFPDEAEESSFFSSLKDRTPIKLIECCYEDTLKHLVEMHGPLVPKKYQFTTKLDETTFVFIRDEISEGKACQQLTERLDEFTNCKFHFGGIVNFTKKGVRSLNLEYKYGSCYLGGQAHLAGPSYSRTLPNPSSLNTSTLKTLQLQNVLTIKRLEIPYVTHLSLIYSDKEGPRPVVRRLFAPRVTRFIVHFNNKVPCFKRMENVASLKSVPHTVLKEAWMTPKERRALMALDYYRMFEFANIPSLNIREGDTELPVSFDPEGENKGMDMRFIRRFTSVNLAGIPYALLRNTPGLLDKVIRLRWTISEDHWRAGYSLPSLRSLSLVFTRRNCCGPALITRKLSCLNVSVMAPYVDISGLTSSMRRPQGGLHWLSVYSTPRLLKSSTDGVYSINSEQWSALQMSYLSSEVSIVGVFIPMLQSEPVMSRTPIWRQCSRITLRPAINVANDTVVERVLINAISVCPKTLIAPIFSRSGEYERVLDLVEGVLSLVHHEPIELTTSAEIDRVVTFRGALGHTEQINEKDSFVVCKKYKISLPIFAHLPAQDLQDAIWRILRGGWNLEFEVEAVTAKKELSPKSAI